MCVGGDLCFVILTNRYLRALGSNGTILALGDASSIEGVTIPTTGQVTAGLCCVSYELSGRELWSSRAF